MLKQEINQMNCYLESSEAIDFQNPGVQKKAASLAEGCADEVDLVKKVYEYVRDQFPHSFDLGATAVSISASDVLKNGHGICYAKSHLFAALLRYLGIPVGFCYQILLLTDEEGPFVVHAVSAVYLKSLGRWIRLDCRGNKPGVDAQFSLDKEKLAFPVRREWGEGDGTLIFAQPSKRTLEVLYRSKTVDELIRNLPSEI